MIIIRLILVGSGVGFVLWGRFHILDSPERNPQRWHRDLTPEAVRRTIRFGRILGWVCVVCGSALVFVGVIAQPS